MNSIIESAGYDTIGVEALYSKLKATEVDYKLRDSLACTGSKSLALATPSSESVANPPYAQLLVFCFDVCDRGVVSIAWG